jgi:membrane-bound lytic murein transglycosylase F
LWLLPLVCIAFVVTMTGPFPVGCREEEPPWRDLEQVLHSGKITVITRNNANCYYIYQDRPMGFEYELARAFAGYLGVQLEVRIAPRWNRMIPEIRQGQGDFIAAGMTVTPDRQQRVRFSTAYMKIQQHIIVRRGNRQVKSAADLAGRTVDVREGTSYQRQLEILQRRGIDVKIRLHADTPTETLIRQVAEGRIEITIADSNIAKLNRRYYPNIRIADAISGPQVLAWAFHPRARRLLEKANDFFARIQRNGVFEKIHRRYYANVDIYDFNDLKGFHRRIKTRLPRYINLIRRTAEEYHMDWRLLAALIYQESHFNPGATSSAGAAGMMQLLPDIAKKLGVENIFDPAENIRAGVKHLKRFYDFYDKARDPDRLYIALAAYNIGMGHILDARNIARAKNLDPDKWSSLVHTLPLLSDQKYFRKAIYGYCRGTEPVRFVQKIRIYYDILKRQAIVYPPAKS